MAGQVPFSEFTVHNDNGSDEVVTSQQLEQYAELYGIPQLIPGRYSDLLLLDLYLSEKNIGLSPEQVVQEIKSLETGSQSYMKPPTQFTRKPLKGLWHKHFLMVTPSSMAHNILNELGKHGTKRAAEAAFHPSKGEKVTPEMLNDFVNQVVEAPIQNRSDRASLTGEWLICAKHNGENYYLCIANHKHGENNSDEHVAKRLEAVCCREFEWLRGVLEN